MDHSSQTTVAVLYVAGCPNYRPTLELARAVVAELGVEVAVEGIEVMTVEEAVRLRFLGSPSVQIDGVDIEPGARASTAYGVACRTYGGAGVPPRRLLVEALANVPGT